MKNAVKYILLLLITSVLINACDKKKTTEITLADLEQYHREAKELIDDERINATINDMSRGLENETPEQQQAWQIYLQNVEITNQYGIDYLLTQKGLNVKILDIIRDLYYFEQQKGSIGTNEYQYLLDQYRVAREDFKFAFMGFEIYKILKLKVDQGYYNRQYNIDPIGCALAVAGTLVTTIGAITVTGGAGLVIWLVSKGISTASVIYSCALS